MTDWLTISEVARLLRDDYGLENVSRKTVQRRCVDGKVRCRKTDEGWYLVPESELQALAESLRPKGP